MASAEEDEWEYEYDENETEDFYIPIDVANVPKLQGPINALPKIGHPVLLKTKLRALNAEFRETQNPMDPSTASDSTSMGEIQINGLHTPNPLVLYNDQLLSCQWTSTIGTDLMFAKPNPSTSSGEEPLRSLPSVDLLAISSARLIAKVARLRPRDDLFTGTRDEQQTPDPMDISIPPQGDLGGSNEMTEITETVGPTQPASSSFLEKLNAAKDRRGDKTQLKFSRDTNGVHLVAEKKQSNPSRSNQEVGDEGEDTVMGGV